MNYLKTCDLQASKYILIKLENLRPERRKRVERNIPHIMDKTMTGFYEINHIKNFQVKYELLRLWKNHCFEYVGKKNMTNKIQCLVKNIIASKYKEINNNVSHKETEKKRTNRSTKTCS